MDTQWPLRRRAFSWSSEGQFDRYAADIERSGYAVPVLIGAAARAGGDGPEDRHRGAQHGRAHTLSALGGAVREAAGADRDELILAAPDVSAEHDNDDFGHLLERDAPCVQRTTIYASDNDMALMASESVHGGIRAPDACR